MIASLPLFHRIAGQPVIVLGTGEAAQAKRRLVERAGGIVVDDLQRGVESGARLAFVAHESAEAARADTLRLRDAGLLVNVPDRPELCDFTVPSILDRSPVLLAIGTGGASAGLAKALRLRLEGLLPQSLGRLALTLADARERMRARWPDAGERRRALDEALGPGEVLDPLAETSADRAGAWPEAGAGRETIAGRFEFRVAGDDPDDLTLRQARALGAADMLVHEQGVSAAILDRARADAARVPIPRAAPAPEGAGFVVIVRT